MILVAAAFAMYAVHPIALPAQTVVDLPIVNGFVPDYDQGRSSSLSRSGSLALIIHSDDRAARTGRYTSRILVIRKDGTRVFLDLPQPQLLATTLYHYAFDRGYTGRDPPVHFTDVSLADDGTPFATVAYFFDGAYSGDDEAAFIWNGEAWRNALPGEKHSFRIGAAESVVRVAFVRTHSDEPGAVAGVALSDPHWHEDRVVLGADGSAHELGYGIATALRGEYLVGYRSGSYVRRAADPPHPFTAVEWTGVRTAVLGPGIAFGVSASGEAVGTNVERPSEMGQPVLWQRGIRSVLSGSNGSAFAISDDGTIVGSAGGRGFIASDRGARRRLVALDSLLLDRSWHIVAALGIAANGRIEAVAERPGGAPQIVLLDPIAKRSS
jgi:hypothetical protein